MEELRPQQTCFYEPEEFYIEGMNEANKAESHMTSAAAFVEGGIQDACEDTCSICLEGFSDSDPSTITSCKHEFHLQCILEWCQRSSNCPMCWQNISLKDLTSQELLEAVEHERNVRLTPSRNTTIFHHPTLGDFELQHLPMGVNDPDLEDRIIQHLAAAAAMGRTHRIARRDGSRARSSAHARPQFVLFSSHANGTSTDGAEFEPASTENNTPSVTNDDQTHVSSSVQNNQISASSSGSPVMPINRRGSNNDNRIYASQSSLPNQGTAGPSEFQSLTDTWKSRFSSMSMKYKESISKSTRGWKEKLFSRNTSIADIGSEVRREVNAGIATVSRMMERLETRDNRRADRVIIAHDVSDTEGSNNNNRDTPQDTPSNGNNSASLAAS